MANTAKPKAEKKEVAPKAVKPAAKKPKEVKQSAPAEVKKEVEIKVEEVIAPKAEKKEVKQPAEKKADKIEQSAKRKKILIAASEALPYVKTGGLADVAAALPKALNADGYDCRVIMPLYFDIPDDFKHTMRYLGNVYVPLAWRNQYCGVFTQTYEGVTYYFIDNEFYFKRRGLYGHYDDGERFAFFSKAILESMSVT